jgi:hypothetical protein
MFVITVERSLIRDKLDKEQARMIETYSKVSKEDGKRMVVARAVKVIMETPPGGLGLVMDHE